MSLPAQISVSTVSAVIKLFHACSSSEPKPSAARNIYAFGLTSFFNDTATEMAYWVLPAFLVSLGAGPAQLGLIEGVAESVASFAKLSPDISPTASTAASLWWSRDTLSPTP